MAVVTTGTLDGIRTLKDKSLKLNFTTQEVDRNTAADFIQLNGKYLKLVMSDENVDQRIEEIEDELDAMKIDRRDDINKSQSQRIRAALYVLWEKSPNEYDDFELFYRSRTEKIIEQIKTRIKSYEL